MAFKIFGSRARYMATLLRSRPVITQLGGSGAVAAIGLGLALWGEALPRFANLDAALRIHDDDSCGTADVPADPNWSERLDALRTNHDLLEDLGSGLIVGAVAFAMLFIALVLTRKPGCPIWRTPCHRLTYLGIGLGTILIAWSTALFALNIDFDRLNFRWCADSMGIPALMITGSAIFLTLPLMIVGGVVTLGFGRLPVSLLQWDASRPRYSWAVSIVMAAIASVLLINLALVLATSSTYSAPGHISALYLIAATRAALLAKSKPSARKNEPPSTAEATMGSTAEIQ